MTATKTLRKGLFAGASLGLLAACSGGGGGNDPEPRNVTFTPSATVADVSGSAVKGTMIGAQVDFEAVSGSNTTVSASPSDESGDFGAITLTSDAGFGISDAYRVTARSVNGTTMICDTNACGDFGLGVPVDAQGLGGVDLETIVWIETTFGNASDSTIDATFQANMLTTLASILVDQAVADGGRITAEGLLDTAQINASDQLLRILGVEISGVNLFTTDLVSAEAQANFSGVSERVAALSILNAGFSNYDSGETLNNQKSEILAQLNSASRDGELGAAQAIRQYLVDSLAGHPAGAWSGVDIDALINIDLPLVADDLVLGPIQEYTTDDRVAAATITRRAAISAGEEAEFVFDGDISTKWLDNGGVPSEEDPVFVQIEFAEAVPVSVMEITSANDAPERDVENFNIQGSNDGVNFVTLGEFEGAQFEERFETQQFTFTNGLAFTTYRINVTKNFGNNDLTQIAEIELFGPLEADVNHSLDPNKTIDRRAAISAGEEAEFALDGDSSTKWLDNAGAPTVEDPSTLTVTFDTPRAVSTLGLISANDAPERDPENVLLEGSNDGGTTWSAIGSVEGVQFAERFERQTFFFANPVAFETYRVSITKNFGDNDLMQIAEIELIGPQTPGIDHSSTATGFTARAEISAGEAAEFAFDDNSSTKWLDNGGVPSAEDPAFVDITLPEAEAVNFLAVTSANDAPERDPENFQLLGSNDGGTTFDIVADFEGITFDDRFQRLTFPIANQVGYSVYRFAITKNFGNSDLMQIAEIEIVGPADPGVDHSSTATGFTARAEISAGEAAEFAFDDNPSTKWLDNGGVPSAEDPAFVDVQLPTDENVNTLALTSANDAPERDPENFALLGSNDGGATWFEIESWEGITFDDRFQRISLPFVNGRRFDLYRFAISKNFGNSDLMQIAEIELIGPDN